MWAAVRAQMISRADGYCNWAILVAVSVTAYYLMIPLTNYPACLHALGSCAGMGQTHEHGQKQTCLLRQMIFQWIVGGRYDTALP